MKKIITSLFSLNSIIKQLKNFRILAKEYGQYRTIKKWDCVDKDNNKIPWYTYPAIEYLNNIDFTDKSVFEYGSGNSSIYWAGVSKNVISIEDDEDWHRSVSNSLKKNQDILLKKDKKEYVESILQFTNDNFDLVIIDGKYRIECAKQAVSSIKSDGIIILDNSDRKEEEIAAKYIRENFNCIQVDFHGFGPINNYTWTTSIFFSRQCNINSINDIQPVAPIGSI
jgi:hypothetical protein